MELVIHPCAMDISRLSNTQAEGWTNFVHLIVDVRSATRLLRSLRYNSVSYVGSLLLYVSEVFFAASFFL